MMILDSTTIQVGLSISTDKAIFQQAGELILNYDLQNEIADFVRFLLPLIFLHLAVAGCLLNDAAKLIIQYFRGWRRDLNLMWYATQKKHYRFYSYA